MDELPKFEKNFYSEDDAVKSRSEEEVTAFREKHKITVIGEGVPRPVCTFHEAKFPG